MNIKRNLLVVAVLMSQVQALHADILTDIAAERDRAKVVKDELHTSLLSLTGNAEKSRQKMLDLDDKINLLLQEDARRDIAQLNWDRISAMLGDLETLTYDAGARLLEVDGFYDDSDIVTSGKTAGECLSFAKSASAGYEDLSQGIQPGFLKAIEIRGKIATLELYLE